MRNYPTHACENEDMIQATREAHWKHDASTRAEMARITTTTFSTKLPGLSRSEVSYLWSGQSGGTCSSLSSVPPPALPPFRFQEPLLLSFSRPPHPEIRQSMQIGSMMRPCESDSHQSLRVALPPVATSPRKQNTLVFDQEALRAFAHSLCLPFFPKHCFPYNHSFCPLLCNAPFLRPRHQALHRPNPRASAH